MADRCITGKKIFTSIALAEDVLIELWTKNEYNTGHAPIAIYQCEDCSQYHLTSQPPMNERLAAFMASARFKREREANKWADRFKRK
jgi:hypothetical protein